MEIDEVCPEECPAVRLRQSSWEFRKGIGLALVFLFTCPAAGLTLPIRASQKKRSVDIRGQPYIIKGTQFTVLLEREAAMLHMLHPHQWGKEITIT